MAILGEIIPKRSLLSFHYIFFERYRKKYIDREKEDIGKERGGGETKKRRERTKERQTEGMHINNQHINL